MFNIILYLLAIGLLVVSFFKDRGKTKAALLKAWKAFANLLPELVGVIVAIGIMLAVLNPEVVSQVIGEGSGFVGVLIAAVVGSITLIPGFVAFPTAALVLQNGAGYTQIAAFVSTLMMVGVITAPVESKIFGKKMTFLRNFVAFLFSFAVAYIIGMVVGGQ